MIKRYAAWHMARVRGIGVHSDKTGWHVRFTPNFGLGAPWFRGELLRYSRHHGLQVIKWVRTGWNGRWCVKKQILGRSKVVGEMYVNQPGAK